MIPLGTIYLPKKAWISDFWRLFDGAWTTFFSSKSVLLRFLKAVSNVRCWADLLVWSYTVDLIGSRKLPSVDSPPTPVLIYSVKADGLYLVSIMICSLQSGRVPVCCCFASCRKVFVLTRYLNSIDPAIPNSYRPKGCGRTARSFSPH